MKVGAPHAVASEPGLTWQPLVAGWGSSWGLPGLERRVTVSISQRMVARLGSCTPSRGRIRLSSALLAGPPELLLEVLCHELAHAAAYELHGASIRPHGREWRELMRRAGFPPRVRLEVPAGWPSALHRRRRRRRRYLYDHRCPRCSWNRVAGAVVRRWRCPACEGKGLGGELEVWRLAPHRAGG